MKNRLSEKEKEPAVGSPWSNALLWWLLIFVIFAVGITWAYLEIDAYFKR